jgi:hypothetical protein
MTKIYAIWQIVLKMKIITQNKISHKLKMNRFKILNTAYSNRCVSTNNEH